MRSSLQLLKGMQKQGDYLQQGGEFVIGPGNLYCLTAKNFCILLYYIEHTNIIDVVH